MHLILYALLSASLFYLGSRAIITRGLWSRYPARLASFMDCPACTGFWWGFLLSLVLGDLHPQIFVPDVVAGSGARAAIEAIATGLASIVLTPIVTGIMQYGLDLTGSAAPAAIDATMQPFRDALARDEATQHPDN